MSSTSDVLARQRPVYLDYAATTPVDPRVAHQMSRCLMFDGYFGNPASHSHAFGWEAEELVEESRTQLARQSMQILAKLFGPRAPQNRTTLRLKVLPKMPLGAT